MQTTSYRTCESLQVVKLIVIILITIVILSQAPIGIDWPTFAHLWQNVRDPYAAGSFFNPPWILVFLPHALLDIHISNAINLFLNIAVTFAVVKKFGGDWKAMLLVFTSPVFFELMRVNNIEWIPMLAFFLPQSLGMVALSVKPQIFGGMALIWLKRKHPLAWMGLFVVALLLFISSAYFGQWVLHSSSAINTTYNFSAFPLLVPVGLYMLWKAWKSDNDILAGLATPMLVPYIASYSFVPYLAVLACKHKHEAVVIYFVLWSFVVFETRRLDILRLH